MIGLTQAATVYPRTGWSGGAPTYAPEGIALRCRLVFGEARDGGPRGLAREQSAVILAEPAAVRAGDRLVPEGGGAMVVHSVRAVRGLARVHHLEIEAEAEG